MTRDVDGRKTWLLDWLGESRGRGRAGGWDLQHVVNHALLLAVQGADELARGVVLCHLQAAPPHHVLGLRVRSEPHERVDGAPVSLLRGNVERSGEVEVRRVHVAPAPGQGDDALVHVVGRADGRTGVDDDPVERAEAAHEVRGFSVCPAVQEAPDHVLSGVLCGVVQRRHLVRVRSFEGHAVAQGLQDALQVSPPGGREELFLVRGLRTAPWRGPRFAPQEKIPARLQPHRPVLPHARPNARVPAKERTGTTRTELLF